RPAQSHSPTEPGAADPSRFQAVPGLERQHSLLRQAHGGSVELRSGGRESRPAQRPGSAFRVAAVGAGPARRCPHPGRRLDEWPSLDLVRQDAVDADRTLASAIRDLAIQRRRLGSRLEVISRIHIKNIFKSYGYE